MRLVGNCLFEGRCHHLIYPYEGVAPVIDATAFIAPGAVVAGKVEIGPMVSIWYNCVVRGDYDSIKIGACSNIQDGSVLHEIGRAHV